MRNEPVELETGESAMSEQVIVCQRHKITSSTSKSSGLCDHHRMPDCAVRKHSNLTYDYPKASCTDIYWILDARSTVLVVRVSDIVLQQQQHLTEVIYSNIRSQCGDHRLKFGQSASFQIFETTKKSELKLLQN